MTKSKIILASLGVVAGLGTAALPLASYAAQTPQSVSGNVDLYVEVQPAISMTITGNNDGNGSYGTAGDNAQVKVKNSTEATTIDGENVSAYEVATATKASSSYVSLLPNSTATATSTIKVWTNNTSGYTLAVKDSDATTALTKVGASDTIPAGAEAVAAGTAKWNLTGGLLTNAAIAATDQSVKVTDAKTSNGDETVMTYNIATAADQATGVYTDTITYTATTNN
ncbi:hypothetical protein IJ765_00725 [Candidatus Saccharibacteria bacterium]|nr:hypothetical protein [Candidatus Saccharibacteria bacterium]